MMAHVRIFLPQFRVHPIVDSVHAADPCFCVADLYYGLVLVSGCSVA